MQRDRRKNPRHTNARMEKITRERIRARGDVCAICGKPIDYSLKKPDPMAFEVDHIIPISRGGKLYDMDNLQATHRICNERKGNQLDDERDAMHMSLTTSCDLWS